MRTHASIMISMTALLIAVFGSTPIGEAAWNQVVPRNSVGTLQIKRNAVKARQLAPNAVRSAHVLNGSLLAADFKEGQIPQGPKGDKGQKGDKGDRGMTGPVGISGYEIVRASQSVGANTVLAAVVARCPVGKKVLGGASRVVGLGSSGVFFDPQIINDTVNVPGDQAYAVIVYNTNAVARTVEVLATCAQVAG